MDKVKHNVYVAEAALISSLGTSIEEHTNAIEKYATNIQPFHSTPVCLIDRNKIQKHHNCTFLECLSIQALSEVIEKSNISLSDSRTLLILSTTKGNIEYIDADFSRTYLWSTATKIKNHFSAHHTPLIVSNACVSGVAAIIIGARMIERGEYDNVYVLGVDTASEFVVSGFNSFKSISPTICAPYNKDRDGLTIGEACGALLLTNTSRSQIQVCGGGISSDANHISGPSRTGDGLSLAIDQALKDAGISAELIDCINAHGTGTPFNDEMESKAFRLSEIYTAPCNSLKPYIGHTLGASGVVETILLVEQMKKNIFYGVKGYTECGVPYELNVSSKHRPRELEFALKTASGFGGTNAAIVLAKNKKKNKPIIETSTTSRQLANYNIKSSDTENFSEYIKAEYKDLGESNIKFFKMDSLAKLGYVASCRLIQNVDLSAIEKHRIGVVMANRSSSLHTDIKHQEIINQHLEEGASPAVFVYTLANIVAAEISIKHKFQGELSVFIQEEKDMQTLLDYSHKLINDNICDAVLYGWCEFLDDNYEADLRLIAK